ncbi:helix-turn-helix transcriptional regulator [Bdellovibrionota bacterium FG-1]
MRIGKLLQATRKHLGFNQTEVAPTLGLDQSALSRIESGKQFLTASQWFTFCQSSGISPDSLTHGLFEMEQKESAIRLPQRYAFEKGSKVRSLLPLLDFAKETLGERGLARFFSDIKLDPDFFINLSATINFNFTIDLCETIVRKNSMTSKDAELATRTAGNPEMHGSLHHLYEFISSNQIALLTGFVENAAKYSTNFHYSLLNVNPSAEQLEIAVEPAAHMQAFDYQNNPLLGDFFAHYDRGFFQNFSTYSGHRSVKVTLVENLYKGAPRCLYRVKIAA